MSPELSTQGLRLSPQRGSRAASPSLRDQPGHGHGWRSSRHCQELSLGLCLGLFSVKNYKTTTSVQRSQRRARISTGLINTTQSRRKGKNHSECAPASKPTLLQPQAAASPCSIVLSLPNPISGLCSAATRATNPSGSTLGTQGCVFCWAAGDNGCPNYIFGSFS